MLSGCLIRLSNQIGCVRSLITIVSHLMSSVSCHFNICEHFSYFRVLFATDVGLFFNKDYTIHYRRHITLSIYRVSQEECARLRESVLCVKLYRYNPKHLYPKLNGYGDNGHRKVWASGVSTCCTPSVTPYSCIAHARQLDTTS